MTLKLPSWGRMGASSSGYNPSSCTLSQSLVCACSHCRTRSRMKELRRPQGYTSSHISRTWLIKVQSPRMLPSSHCIIILYTLNIIVTCTTELREHWRVRLTHMSSSASVVHAMEKEQWTLLSPNFPGRSFGRSELKTRRII